MVSLGGRERVPVVWIAEAEAGPHGFVVGGSVEQDLEDIAIVIALFSILVGFVGMGTGRLAINSLESEGARDGLRAVGYNSALPGLVDNGEDLGCVGGVGRGGEGNVRGGCCEGERNGGAERIIVVRVLEVVRWWVSGNAATESWVYEEKEETP